MSGDFLLAGVRVIDAASFIAGPVATTIMADLGADVIKIEPPDGDPYRHRTGGPGVAESPYNYRWIVDNRTKRGLVLDLREPAGRAVLHRLVGRADVFVTNTPLDSRAKLGIRWADLAPLNARLVYASMTAYGEHGEEAPRTGFDATALWARTGLMDLVKPSPDSPPARSLPGMGDHPTGVTLFAAIMTALYRRSQTGRGTMVSTSLLANGLWWNAIQVQAALSGARVEPRPSRDEPATALANLYRCADGRWFLLNLLNDDRDWPHLLRAIERPDLGDDPRFAITPARRANARALVPILDEVFRSKPWAGWREILNRHRLTFGEVGTVDDTRNDSQMVASGALVPFDDPRAGAALTVASPLWLDGVEKVAPRFPPELGEHSVEILREAGYGEAEIDALLAARVIVQGKTAS
jgi:crotonobetainyl-CoA:carnitine CoA-transferase CaiB-like acyl-CoA transferase